jgi:cytoskeletal protein CcmA (bactofilin family)
MQDSLRKVPFRCPECGFVQQEPETLISTYCRSCGHYYKGGADRSDKGSSSLLPSLFKGKGRANRLVHCYRCDKEHEVSSSARSTMCPTCNAGIEFDDLVVSSNASRPVDTRGKLLVTKKGYLNNAHIVCGEAIIEGRISGALRCEGAVHLRCSGALSSRITAGSLVVDKHSRIEISSPVTVGELVVYGAVKGQFLCSSKVRVLKGGTLEGTLVTPAVTVERGGTLLADSTIQPPKRPDPVASVAESPIADAPESSES